MTRVLILTASHGTGHPAAASALAATFGHAVAHVRVVDHFRELVPAVFARLLRRLPPDLVVSVYATLTLDEAARSLPGQERQNARFAAWAGLAFTARSRRERIVRLERVSAPAHKGSEPRCSR